MEDMQRSLGGNVAVSEARIFDPANVQVANYDQLAVSDFSNVQYLEITDSEAEEDDEDDGDEVEDREYDHTPAGNAEGRSAPTTILTPAQKRKKEKRKKKAKAKADDSGMFTILHFSLIAIFYND